MGFLGFVFSLKWKRLSEFLYVRGIFAVEESYITEAHDCVFGNSEVLLRVGFWVGKNGLNSLHHVSKE